MEKDKKKLLVLTNTFPYGTGETFIESEVNYWREFDEVLVCPIGVYDPQVKRNLTCNNIQILSLGGSKIRCSEMFCLLIKALFSTELWKEISIILADRHRITLKIKHLLSFTVYSVQRAAMLKKVLKHKDKMTIYSYWLDKTAMIAANIKNKLNISGKIISRAHGYDLYEERSDGYIPYRDYILSACDGIYCVSEKGRTYLSNKHTYYAGKIKCAYLGTKDYGIREYEQHEALRIVSCSNCIPVKRINKIIDALSLHTTDEPKIEWTHFGSGYLQSELEEKAKRVLNDKVRFSFRGAIDNIDVINNYKTTPYDIFVNTSESEGVPVSIMEAMSFGIPVIATDVGGTSELFSNEMQKYLLKSDFSESELYNLIISISKLNYEQYISLRKNVRKQWNNHFRADANYTRFMNDVIR